MKHRVYLSPSLHSGNQTVLGVSQAYLMGLVADAVEPILRANRIDFTRSHSGMSLSEVIAQSNAGQYDAHIGISSNASQVPGSSHGSRMFFFPTSGRGQRLATLMAEEFRKIYWDPARTVVVANDSMAELRATRAPSCLVFTAFHDHEQDARWIQSNIHAIAEAIVKALCAFLGIEYIAPCTFGTVPASQHVYRGFVWALACTREGALNIRNAPNGQILFTVPHNSRLLVTGPIRDGFVPVRVNFWEGWASADFVCICNNTGVDPVPPIGIVPPVTPVPPIGIVPPVTPVPPIGIVPPIMPPIGTIPPVTPVPPIGTLPPVTCPGYIIDMGTVRTQGGNLNMRAQPSMEAMVIAQIPNNTRFLVLRDDVEWYYAFFNNHLGWVSKQFVRLD